MMSAQLPAYREVFEPCRSHDCENVLITHPSIVDSGQVYDSITVTVTALYSPLIASS
jgi:hypothetical protein